MTNYDELAQTTMMNDLGAKRISGGALRKLRFHLALTQTELAAKIGLSPVRVRQIEKSIDAGIQPKIWKKLMDLTGKSLEEVEAMLAIPEPGEYELDNNVEPFSEEKVPEIPTFEMAIAAGPWIELGEVDADGQKPFSLDGRFRVRIRGNSMESTWPDGSLIEFRCLRPDCGDGRGSKLEIGVDYYVQRAESATFKRLESFDDHELVFRAVNRRKYPDKIVVPRSDISRMARAEYILLRPK